MGTLANSEDPDEMQHNAAFNRFLHCLVRLKQLPVTKIIFLEYFTCDPFKYKLDSPKYVWKNPPEYNLWH